MEIIETNVNMFGFSELHRNVCKRNDIIGRIEVLLGDYWKVG